MFSLIKKGIFFGIGMQEKARELAEEVMKRGERSEGKTAKRIKEMVDRGEKDFDDMRQKFRDIACKCVERANIPTRTDIDKLEKEVKDISMRLGRVETYGQARGTD